MRAGGSDQQTAVGGEVGKLAPKLQDLRARALDIGANLRAELNDRLVHLRFDVFLQRYLPVLENLLNVGSQLARLRIDDLEFLLDPKGENVF
jgi:hypothetical protein